MLVKSLYPSKTALFIYQKRFKIVVGEEMGGKKLRKWCFRYYLQWNLSNSTPIGARTIRIWLGDQYSGSADLTLSIGFGVAVSV